MLKCPNCGAELDDGADLCIRCGNPLTEGKPWEKKNQPQKKKDSAAQDETDYKRPKVKHQTRRPARGQYERGVAVLEEEHYLEHEFVIREGYCGYDLVSGREDLAEGEKEPKLKEGTVILTKKAVLFGPSDHAIRCGKYVYEIPVQLIEYVTDTTYSNKPALLIRTEDGEEFKLFVLKRDEWIENFRYVTEYRPAKEMQETGTADREDGGGTDASAEEAGPSRWTRPLIYLLVALGCIVYAFLRPAGFSLLFVVLGVVFIARAIASAIAPGKVKFF